MNSSHSSLSDAHQMDPTPLPTFPPRKEGGLVIPPNFWYFFAGFILILMLLGLISVIRYLLTVRADRRRSVVGDFVNRKEVPPHVIKEISSPTSIQTPAPTANTSPIHTISVPHVVVTPPTPIPGEEERTKKRAYSLDEF